MIFIEIRQVWFVIFNWNKSEKDHKADTWCKTNESIKFKTYLSYVHPQVTHVFLKHIIFLLCNVTMHFRYLEWVYHAKPKRHLHSKIILLWYEVLWHPCMKWLQLYESTYELSFSRNKQKPIKMNHSIHKCIEYIYQYIKL